MIEVLISSSVLILAVCLMRAVSWGRISLKVRYGLWGLAALRLVYPMFYPLQNVTELFRSRFSVMNAADAVHRRIVDGTGLGPLADNVATGHVYTFEGGSQAVSLAQRAAGIDWQLWIMAVWVTGAVVLGMWMAVVNIRFHRMLLAERRLFHGKAPDFVKDTIYMVDGMKSPCYFGLGTDVAVYIPSFIAEDEDMLRHALAHETCHASHGDRFWGILRCVILCYYWVNPLVWLAAVLSRRDCELACDEAAVRLLGEKERYAYGRTLVGLIAGKDGSGGLFSVATTMTAGKRTIQERIRLLAKRPRTTAGMMAAVVLAVAALAACTFTGGTEHTEEMEAEVTQANVSGDEGSHTESVASAGDHVPVGQGDMLVLAYAEQWGNYYRLTMERRDAESGRILTGSYEQDGEVNVTCYADTAGTMLSGDGLPDWGFGYVQNRPEAFTVSLWNIEHAGSFRISIVQDGGSADYLFVAKDRELLDRYSSVQTVKGPDDTSVRLLSAEEYPDAYFIRLLGGSAGEAARFGDNSRIMIKLRGNGDGGRLYEPENIYRHGAVIDVLFCFDEDIFPGAKVQDILVMNDGLDSGVATQLDAGLTTPFVYDVAWEFCEAYTDGDVGNAAKYSVFPEKELTDAMPKDPSHQPALSIRWNPELKDVYAEGIYRFKSPGEDSFTYLNVELKFAYGEWKVTGKWYEK